VRGRLAVDINIEFRRAFQDRLVRWYRRNGREFPWRVNATAYQVAVSEILLQQTQAARVQPVYETFVDRWPRAQDLYRASLSDVKAITDPLGHHIRGLWLKELARHIVEFHDGRLPADLKGLRGIPGLGPYAAAAVYVFGLHHRAALLDTNVARVLTRVVGLPVEGSVYRDGRRLQALAECLVPARRYFDYHQGLMDLGATICRSRAPSCVCCPVRAVCRAVTGGSPVATWRENDIELFGERTVGHWVGSRVAVPGKEGQAISVGD
jgi:A/G-specific adenine glycosylase